MARERELIPIADLSGDYWLIWSPSRRAALNRILDRDPEVNVMLLWSNQSDAGAFAAASQRFDDGLPRCLPIYAIRDWFECTAAWVDLPPSEA